MKKIIALVLAMACVLGLMAGCVSPAAPTTNAPTTNAKPSQPTDPTTPSQPTDPTNPSDPTDPSEPSDPEVPTLPGAPVNGDKVHIFLPEKNLALGYNPDAAKPQRMEAVAGTVTDGVLTAEGAGVFNVIVNKDGTYTFMCGGKYLTTGESGNSLSLEYDPSDYSIWTLEEAGNGNFYIKSNAVYGGNAQYLEYYSGFTTYKFQEAQAGIYTFQFFKTDAEQPAFPPKPSMPADGSELTIEQILALPLEDGAISSERYYVTATVATISKKWFGEMTLVDSTGSISVFKSLNADGTVKYENMTEKPMKGDTVKMLVNVKNFGGTYELHDAWIIEFTKNPFELGKYTEMTIADARNAAKGEFVNITGVVAQITYANSNVPSANGKLPVGVILVDGTSSIYVYSNDVAQNVEIGNTITICGTKTMWVLGTEQANANKFGYAGCNQVEDAYLISNDKATTEFNKSWIEETTVQQLLATPFTTDITTKIFKVTAQVKKVPGSGFVNYYFNDLDGVTGSYAYTQCNGADFAWLDAFDGKICTVYLMALNAKSTATGCNWRLLPVAVIDENFDITSVNVPENAVKLYAMPQLVTNYTTEFTVELKGSVDNALLQYTGAVLTYTSSNDAVITFEVVDGKVMLKTVGVGTATVTVTATHNEKTYSETIEVTVTEKPVIEYVNVAGAINTVPGTEESPVYVTVKGIVGPSLVNQTGFYLIDETGVIAVLMLNKEMLKDIEPGQEVILRGIRYHKNKHAEGNTDFGQTCIKDAEIVINNGGNHPYSTESFKGEISVKDFTEFDKTVDHTTEVYTMKVKVAESENGYAYVLTSADGSFRITLYSGSKGQYSWLAQYIGQEITVEVAACNWNSKGYKGCVLAIVLPDGTKIINTLNFND